MKRTIQVAVAALVLSLLVLGGIGSCKQGEGARCQVQEDCEEPFICSTGEGVCVTSGTSDIDAEPPTPAPDAAVDAPLDAAPDAMM